MRKMAISVLGNKNRLLFLVCDIGNLGCIAQLLNRHNNMSDKLGTKIYYSIA